MSPAAEASIPFPRPARPRDAYTHIPFHSVPPDPLAIVGVVRRTQHAAAGGVQRGLVLLDLPPRAGQQAHGAQDARANARNVEGLERQSGTSLTSP